MTITQTSSSFSGRSIPPSPAPAAYGGKGTIGGMYISGVPGANVQPTHGTGGGTFVNPAYPGVRPMGQHGGLYTGPQMHRASGDLRRIFVSGSGVQYGGGPMGGTYPQNVGRPTMPGGGVFVSGEGVAQNVGTQIVQGTNGGVLVSGHRSAYDGPRIHRAQGNLQSVFVSDASAAAPAPTPPTATPKMPVSDKQLPLPMLPAVPMMPPHSKGPTAHFMHQGHVDNRVFVSNWPQDTVGYRHGGPVIVDKNSHQIYSLSEYGSQFHTDKPWNLNKGVYNTSAVRPMDLGSDCWTTMGVVALLAMAVGAFGSAYLTGGKKLHKVLQEEGIKHVRGIRGESSQE